VDLEFDGAIFEWRGPAPFYWVALPEEACDLVAFESSQASYGWGAVPVTVRIGGTEWETSLLPKGGGYVLPVKQAVRKAERIDEGDTVGVALAIAPRGGRQANGTGTTTEPHRPAT